MNKRNKTVGLKKKSSKLENQLAYKEVGLTSTVGNKARVPMAHDISNSRPVKRMQSY